MFKLEVVQFALLVSKADFCYTYRTFHCLMNVSTVKIQPEVLIITALINSDSYLRGCRKRKLFLKRKVSCQNVCDALSYRLDNIYIRVGTKLCRQIVGISMGSNCAPLVADLCLYCFERDFMDSLNHDNQADVIEAFNSTSRYLDGHLNIDKEQVGKDQEKAQSEKDSHSKNRGGKKPN